MDEDIQLLLQNIYSVGDNKSVYQALTNTEEYYNSEQDLYYSGVDDTLTGVKLTPSDLLQPKQRSAYKLEPLNYKSKIFGQLLRKKFMDKYEIYKKRL